VTARSICCAIQTVAVRAARRLSAVIALSAMGALSSCGGSSGPSIESIGPVVLSAKVSEQGTELECTSSRPLVMTLVRDSVSQGTLDCPFKRRLAADWHLSDWELRTSSGELVATSASTLRAPLVLGLTSTVYILKDAHIRDLAGLQLRARARLSSGALLEVDGTPLLVRIAPAAGERVTEVQWVAQVGTREFTSELRPVVAMQTQPIGPLVGMAVTQPGPSQPEVFFAAAAAVPGTWDARKPLRQMGLERLVDGGRALRDLRLADLDGDGREDIVSNVYAPTDGNPVNCTLIAFGQGEGRFEYVSPTREDGSCLAGYGETILIADFDGDGRLDIFIPFYERFDLLLNQGDRRFVNVAIERGVNFPFYLPAPEGAAAVDLNLDGHVDTAAGKPDAASELRQGLAAPSGLPWHLAAAAQATLAALTPLRNRSGRLRERFRVVPSRRFYPCSGERSFRSDSSLARFLPGYEEQSDDRELIQAESVTGGMATVDTRQHLALLWLEHLKLETLTLQELTPVVPAQPIGKDAAVPGHRVPQPGRVPQVLCVQMSIGMEVVA